MGDMSVRDLDGSQGDESGITDSTTTMSSSRQVHVEIDELVLTGFTRSQGEEIADSLRETMALLIAGDAARWHESESMNVGSLDAGKVQMRRSGRAKSPGELIARAVYGSLPR